MFSFIQKFPAKLVLFLSVTNFALELPKLVGIVDGVVNLALHAVIGYYSVLLVYRKYKKEVNSYDSNGTSKGDTESV